MASTYKQIPAASSSSAIDITSASPELDVQQAGNDFTLSLDLSGVAVAEAAAVVNNFTAGETIARLKVIYYDHITTKVLKADKSSIITASCIGIAKTAGSLNNTIEAIQYGLLTDPSFSFTPGELIFLSEDGDMTITAPDTGYLTRVGRAVTANTILVLIESPITL